MFVDTHIYYVTTINGYRSAWLTKTQAEKHAANLRCQMNNAGWRGKVQIYYRNGEVTTSL